MNHLALVHYMEFLLPCDYLINEIYVNSGVFDCTQMRCGKKFETLSGLVLHENMAHSAMEGYIGEFIEPNDLYLEL